MSSHFPVFHAYEWASGLTCPKLDARLSDSSCARARRLIVIQEARDKTAQRRKRPRKRWLSSKLNGGIGAVVGTRQNEWLPLVAIDRERQQRPSNSRLRRAVARPLLTVTASGRSCSYEATSCRPGYSKAERERSRLSVSRIRSGRDIFCLDLKAPKPPVGLAHRSRSARQIVECALAPTVTRPMACCIRLPVL